MSTLISRNPTYIQQFIKRGSPKKLPEAERGILARYFGVNESLLGGPIASAVKTAICLTVPIRDGIHIIRLDDVLIVKRLANGPGGRLSVLSDNPAYPGWPDVDGATVTVIGRVVWVGRRL